MGSTLNLDLLSKAVSGDAAALRCRRRLQPAGGEGDKVFPPTYAGAVYATEQRRVKDQATGQWQTVPCVILDSVQSQANRMEEALQAAIDEGTLRMPLVVVDFEGARAQLLEPVGKVSSLQAPHRIVDAILRDSVHDGKPFRASTVGGELDRASVAFATPLLRLCPQALLFGMWDSTGPKGGLGTKFERAVVSEVVGIHAERVEKNRGIRRDPLQVRAAVKVQRGADHQWRVAEESAGRGMLSPSEINHSSVPFDNDNGGVTVDYAEQTTTLSLIALRRLRFPLTEGAAAEKEVNEAARTVLAAMGLYAAALAFGPGMDLRSRCLLFPEEPMRWEVLEKPGEAPQQFSLDKKAAENLLTDAIAAAKKMKLPWDEEPVVLTPSAQLVQLVRKSQELAVAEAEAD